MKTLFIVISMLVPFFVFAGENCSTTTDEAAVEEKLEIKTDVPKFLEGATICVKLADGKESCVPAEKFKVVARKQQFIVTKTRQQTKTMCSADKDKNRLSLLAGKGAQEGLNRTNNGSTVTIESRVGAVGGAQYQRLLTDKLSIGVQLQTNESVLGSIGIDF